MNKTIWKYELETTDVQKISIPKGAKILCLQIQFGKPCIWVLVDPTHELESIGIFTYGTGHPIPTEPYPHKYIGTYQLKDGMLVFHVFSFTTPQT